MARSKSGRRSRRSSRGGRRGARRSQPSRRQKLVNRAELRKKIALWVRVGAISAIINGVIIALLVAIAVAGPPRVVQVLRVSPPQTEKPENPDAVPKPEAKLRSTSAASSVSRAPVIISNSASAVSFTPADITLDDVGMLGSNVLGLGATSGIGMGGNNGSAKVGGTNVRSRRLGVILDVSGSMTEQLKAVRKEISEGFSRASIVEVTGCRIDWNDDPAFDPGKAAPGISFEKNAESVLHAVEMLIRTRRVDAIFWFSDLADVQTKDGVQRLSNLLGTQFGSESTPIRFYVHSVNNEPSEAMISLSKRSGGATKVKSYETE